MLKNLEDSGFKDLKLKRKGMNLKEPLEDFGTKLNK